MPDARVSLVARDGDVVADVDRQLARIPNDATHLVLSVGGNDALGYIDVLTERADSVGRALLRMSEIRDEFERGYRAMLESLVARRLPVTVCTIYYPAFDEPGLQRMAIGALTFFDDVILRAAFDTGVPVIELRLVCDERSDYANPIEPSARGGMKISRVIARVVRDHDFRSGASTVYARA